jgi:hypothetical protein
MMSPCKLYLLDFLSGHDPFMTKYATGVGDLNFQNTFGFEQRGPIRSSKQSLLINYMYSYKSN